MSASCLGASKVALCSRTSSFTGTGKRSDQVVGGSGRVTSWFLLPNQPPQRVEGQDTGRSNCHREGSS